MLCIITGPCLKSNTIHIPWRTTEALHLVSFLDSALHTSSLADFNLYPFPVTNQSQAYNHFQRILSHTSEILTMKVTIGKLVIGNRSESGLVWLLPLTSELGRVLK